jgi:uncharacterized protein DUF4124
MRRAVAIAVLISLPLSAVLADVYRSVDAQGHVQYSDTPSEGAELLHVSGPQRALTSQARNVTTTASNKSLTPAKSDPQVQEQLAQEDAARAVHNDVAQTRADQCKKAQDAYDKSVQARRIYTTGADGERQYLSDADADAERVKSKLELDSACKNQ